jgi:probable rRNA maturation factor
VHGDWLDDPTPTDVISFPIDGDEFGEHAFDGELVIGFEHAQRVARELQQDFATELALYVVHGALHLLGYDDHAEDDLVRMKLAESQVMRALGMNVRERYE